MKNRNKKKVTLDLFEDTINDLKKISGNNRYASTLRNIIDMGLYVYNDGFRFEKRVVKKEIEKAKKENKSDIIIGDFFN